MSELVGLDAQQKLAAGLLNAMPKLTRLHPKVFRPLFRTMDRVLGLPKLEMCTVKDHKIPLTTCNKKIKIRHYKPEDHSRGTVVYFHGGGCVVGDIETHDRLCRYLTYFGQMDVLSVDYRCGPEAKFPAAIHDAIDAWNWINEQNETLEIDAEKIGVAGDSAGAYLAALISLTDEHKELPVSTVCTPKFQVLLYPMMDLRGNTKSYTTFNSGLILTNELMDYFARHYLEDMEQVHHPLASPLLINDLSNSPKTYILTLEFDPLRDSGIAYAAKLKAAGVDVMHDHFEDCMHSFVSVARVSQRAKQATHVICAALKSMV